MNRDSRFHGSGLRPFLAACACAALMQGALFAEGVTRTVEPVLGGCRVTLAWDFSGSVESDLILEERFAAGWTVDGATVPFASLDASWLSGAVARFAVKPSLLSQAGSITFTVVSDGATASGAVSGDWKMYRDGALRKGVVSGALVVASLVDAATNGNKAVAGGESGASGSAAGGTSLAITSFKMTKGEVVRAAAMLCSANANANASASANVSTPTSGTLFTFTYAGLAQGGMLVVEGCADLGGSWTEVKRVAAAAGDGTVTLAQDEAGDNRFFKLKLVTEEE